MQSSAFPVVCLSLLALFSIPASASLLNTTNIATVLAGITSPCNLTIPLAAMVAITKLGSGGATANDLTAADKTAIDACTEAARNGNEASKGGLGAGTGSAGNIAFVAAKTTLHACEPAQQQIALAAGSTASSDATVTLFDQECGRIKRER